jgi:hypothetical protein
MIDLPGLVITGLGAEAVEPYPTGTVFIQAQYVIVGQAFACGKAYKPDAVITAHTLVGADPYKTIAVFNDIIHFIGSETIVNIKMMVIGVLGPKL